MKEGEFSLLIILNSSGSFGYSETCSLTQVIRDLRHHASKEGGQLLPAGLVIPLNLPFIATSISFLQRSDVPRIHMQFCAAEMLDLLLKFPVSSNSHEM